jgi:hypothetical protein
MNRSGTGPMFLNGKYREIGIGVDNRGSGNLVFTVNFGTHF